MMMEVKQSPTVPLLDYVSANSDNSNSTDASALLKSTTASSTALPREKLDNESKQNGEIIDDDLDFHDAVDDAEPINSDLEDALLADDDLMGESSKAIFNLDNLDKAENSTDPGDDLDRLLSKINDIVEGSDVNGSDVKSDEVDKTKDCEQMNGSKEEEKEEESKVIKDDKPSAEVTDADEEIDETIKSLHDDDDVVMNTEKESKIQNEAKEVLNDSKENLKNTDNKRESEEQESSEAKEKVELEGTQILHEEDLHKNEKAAENVKEFKVLDDKNDEINSTKNIEQCAPSSSSCETAAKEKLDAVVDNTVEIAKTAEDNENKAEKQNEDEMVTLVLDDDDDEDVDMAPTATETEKRTSEQKNNDEKEVVCLEDVDKKNDDEKEAVCLEDVNKKNDDDKEIVCLEDVDKKNDDDKEIVCLEDVDMTVTASETTANKLNNMEKKIDENEEIVCLDDDDDDVGEANDTITVKLESSEVKPDLAAVSGENKVFETETTLPTKETVVNDESKDANSVEGVEVETEKKDEKVVNESEIEISENQNENKDSEAKETISKDSEDASVKKIEEKEETSNKDNESEKSLETQKPKKPNELISDNTDNACDGLELEKNKENSSEKTDQNEEDARSEASSGSNLLQEAQAPNENEFEVRDDADEEDAECEIEDGDEVIMLVEGGDLEKNAENDNKEDDVEIPPAKRLRLSTDSSTDKNLEENSSNKTEVKEKELSENEKSNETEKIKADNEIESDEKDKTAVATTKLKRAFSEAAEIEESKHKTAEDEPIIESASKKPKTSAEDEATASTETKLVEPVKNDEEKSVLEKLLQLKPSEELTDVKQHQHIAIPSNKPIPLYPPPKFEDTPKKLSLDFLQRFRKTFNQMTKNDLEELVLQKVVEALVYENEFADLRMIIDKQDKVITLHRSKLAQLVKQYRDLEMVHTRVVKDMREKNSQYLMPVRITRAVGLQVSTPSMRKPDGPVAQIAPNVMPAAANASTGMMRAPQNIQQQQQQQQAQQQQQKRLTASPQRPQQAANLMLPSTSSTSTNAVNVAAANAAQQPVRRGCMQKVTAQRPVNGTNVTSSTNPPMASIPASSYTRPLLPKSSPSTSADGVSPNPSRILNKNPQLVANNRARYSSGNGASPVQQTKSPPQLLNRQSVAGNSAGKINAANQNKMQQQSQFRRSESSPSLGGTPNAASKTSTATSNYMEQYKNSFNQAMPTVSITPARPKDKSVIDLTDEDDAPQQLPSMTPRNRVVAQQQTNIPNNPNSRQNVPPSLTRMPSGVTVRPQITPRQLSTMQNAQKNIALQQQQQQQQQQNQTAATVTTPTGMSITRVSVNQANPATQRIRYSHPAALPPTPPQQFSPGWKLPPPRPTIRISNLENGIVISWTMEEPMDRHAEVTTYQIYAYQETNAPPSTDSWRHVGDVKAMLLPMAVTLTQFQEDQRYFFAVRAMDTHQRYGQFSAPRTWN